MVRALAGMPEKQSSNPALFLFSFVRSKNRLYYEKRRKIMDKKQSAIVGITGIVLSAVGGICTIVYELFSKRK